MTGIKFVHGSSCGYEWDARHKAQEKAGTAHGCHGNRLHNLGSHICTAFIVGRIPIAHRNLVQVSTAEESGQKLQWRQKDNLKNHMRV